MNRILRYANRTGQRMRRVDPDMAHQHMNDPEEKSPLERSPEAPTICSFCKASVVGDHFSAISKARPVSVICRQCLAVFNQMAKFANESFSIYFKENPDYGPLHASIRKRLAFEAGTKKMKTEVANVAVRVLIRSSAILSGETGTCKRTRLNLDLIRVCFVGKESDACAELLRIACAEANLAFMETTPELISDGSAFRIFMKTFAQGERKWADNGVLFSRGCPAPLASCSVACSSETGDDVPECFEKICVDETGIDLS